MGALGFCAKSCGLVALMLALFIGWACTHQHPLGALFIVIFKLQGIGKPATEPVPEDLVPMPRPTSEMFFELPNGSKMPAIGIGMCCRPTAYDPESVRRTISWYLLQGGRHIDTASMYMNHEAVGLGIKDAMARGVPREEIFVVTKLSPDDFGYHASIKRGSEMVKELGLDYVDLVLLHAPIQINVGFFMKIIQKKLLGSGGGIAGESSESENVKLRAETWKGLSTLRERGLYRNIGVSNFKIEHMKEIQALHLAPIAANQMQFHPWVPVWMKEIVDFCQRENIVVTGYFSLGGFDHKNKLLQLEVVNGIAKSHERRPAQILLRWSLQKGVSIIPGTGNHRHMSDNLGTYGFELSKEEMDRLDGLSSLPLSEDFMYFDL
eukprot:TRINITY_DN65469_c0_g1_i1.p1 TRINITY_DN65469_c0_g1~~TRINITY_DN65469_c0_g1_i1.p1  ORF type:complete len:379 (+),score=63.67 TRINITY_DN65469_c0_g1_i1:42-1178(+)